MQRQWETVFPVHKYQICHKYDKSQCFINNCVTV